MAEEKEEFFENFEEISRQAKEEADRRVAHKIASLTRLTEEEIRSLFPEPADREKLAELTEVVKSAESQNRKINRIADRAEDFAGVIFTLLDSFL